MVPLISYKEDLIPERIDEEGLIRQQNYLTNVYWDPSMINFINFKLEFTMAISFTRLIMVINQFAEFLDL